MFSVTALGELLIDFTDAGTSAAGQKLFERNPGGAPANVLVALERLGMSTAFIGKVGQDMHGEFLRATLVANDVNCDGLVMDPNHFTTLAFVALTEDGERTFSFARKPGADTQLTPEELNRDVIEDSRVFHVGSLSLTDEPARSATVAALDMAKAAGIASEQAAEQQAQTQESKPDQPTGGTPAPEENNPGNPTGGSGGSNSGGAADNGGGGSKLDNPGSGGGPTTSDGSGSHGSHHESDDDDDDDDEEDSHRNWPYGGGNCGWVWVNQPYYDWWGWHPGYWSWRCW